MPWRRLRKRRAQAGAANDLASLLFAISRRADAELIANTTRVLRFHLRLPR
nr:hypothetical protein [Kibdelosporangium sp. MJ126-NF4]CEL13663.1 hypothetical protein [Kibdelosporangium sp. MJ126-NF4]CTQ99349.1 hypothetical protein [Kibdelosporangium sp. MJ126-NF4]